MNYRGFEEHLFEYSERMFGGVRSDDSGKLYIEAYKHEFRGVFAEFRMTVLELGVDELMGVMYVLLISIMIREDLVRFREYGLREFVTELKEEW